MTLLELADRCENAAAPDRELDEAIAPEFGWQLFEMSNFDTGRMWHEWKCPPGFRLPLGTMALPPFYTASLDAAMTLVPGSWQALIASDDHATVRRGGKSFRAENCATPALALCAAALKARAATVTA